MPVAGRGAAVQGQVRGEAMSDRDRQVVLDAEALGEKIEWEFYYRSDLGAPGDVLAAWLSHHGVSQGQLAERLGIGRDTVNKLVNGRRAVTARTAVQLAEATDIPAMVWLVLQSARDLGNL